MVIQMEFIDFKILYFYFDIEEKKIICKTDLIDKKYKFVFLLVKDGKKVEEIRWIDANNYSFKYYGDGIYYCQVEVKCINYSNTIRRSKTIECFSNDYCNFLDNKFSTIPSTNYNCILSQRDYPDDDFCIITMKEHKQINIEVDQFKSHKIQDSIIITNGKIYNHHDKNFVMSGSCISKDHKFIRGGEDIIKYNIKYKNIFNCLGKYTFAIFDDSKIILLNDFHGQNKLYYFNNNKFIVIGNRLHLLIICLKKLNIHLKLFEDKAIGFLSCRYHHLFVQNFCSESLIRNIFQSYAGELFYIKKGELKIFHSGIYNIIAKIPNIVNEKDYINKLDNVRKEIINNLSTIINSEHYEKIIIDVTGGMDSRIALAALTNIKTNKKIYYRISKTDKELENQIALLLAGFYNYNFFDGTDINKKSSKKDFLSFSMETKYLDQLDTELINEKYILLNGFYGEANVRPRFSRDFYFNSFLSTITDPAEYIKTFFPYHISPFMIVDYSKSGYKLYNIFKHEFLTIYGYDIPSKLENHCLNYAHSYHCSPSYFSPYILESYSPIKSKALIELHRSNALAWKNIKLGLDLTYKLNPIFTKIKYENNQYNIFIEKNFDKLLISKDHIYSNLNNLYSNDVLSKWEKSLINLNNNLYPNKSSNKEQNTIYVKIISMFNFCIQHVPTFNTIKYPIYHFIENNKDNKLEMNILFNKLAVLSYFISVINSKKI